MEQYQNYKKFMKRPAGSINANEPLSATYDKVRKSPDRRLIQLSPFMSLFYLAESYEN